MLQPNALKTLVLKLSMAAIGMILLPAIAQATPADQPSAIKNLNRLLSDAQSITASFHQTTTAGKKTSVFSGVMAAQRQNQFRWETKSPAEQLIIANGSVMWIYDKDLNQVIKQSANNQVGDTPALLLSGDPDKLANNFNIWQPDSEKNYFKLTPKSSNAGFNELYISFNGGKPVLMVLNDALGQRTDIRFSNISLNKKLSASQFNFVPPNGVEVISP